MNAMVANLYVNKTGASASVQEKSDDPMETSSKPDEEQQTKRKQSSEKSTKKVKRQRPTESSASNDIDGKVHFPLLFSSYRYASGPDVEYSTTTFEDFAASDSFKEVRFHFPQLPLNYLSRI